MLEMGLLIGHLIGKATIPNPGPFGQLKCGKLQLIADFDWISTAQIKKAASELPGGPKSWHVRRHAVNR
jgi:hypothetical protein